MRRRVRSRWMISWRNESCEVGGVTSGLIKTGREIHNQGFSNFGAGDHQRINDDMYAKWVSLSLLKDYIRLRKKILTKGGDAWTELHLVELLLKEKKT